MKPGNLRKTQGAKSGGSVSKDEGAWTLTLRLGGAFFIPPTEERTKYYGKATVYL